MYQILQSNGLELLPLTKVYVFTPELYPTGGLIRVDDAPGFVALQTDNVLTNFGIQIDLGRTKNVNKNATADKAVQEIEKEIKPLVPDGGPITPSTLALRYLM